jgi:hypothetical protein
MSNMNPIMPQCGGESKPQQDVSAIGIFKISDGELNRLLALAGLQVPVEGWVNDNPVNMDAAGAETGGEPIEVEFSPEGEMEETAEYDYGHHACGGEKYSINTFDYKGRPEATPDDFKIVNHYGDNALKSHVDEELNRFLELSGLPVKENEDIVEYASPVKMAYTVSDDEFEQVANSPETREQFKSISRDLEKQYEKIIKDVVSASKGDREEEDKMWRDFGGDAGVISSILVNSGFSKEVADAHGRAYVDSITNGNQSWVFDNAAILKILGRTGVHESIEDVTEEEIVALEQQISDEWAAFSGELNEYSPPTFGKRKPEIPANIINAAINRVVEDLAWAGPQDQDKIVKRVAAEFAQKYGYFKDHFEQAITLNLSRGDVDRLQRYRD